MYRRVLKILVYVKIMLTPKTYHFPGYKTKIEANNYAEALRKLQGEPKVEKPLEVKKKSKKVKRNIIK